MKDEDLPPMVRFALGLAIGAMLGPALIPAIVLGASVVARFF